jgi:uncharacterized membrane protein YjgN (DUF898 family)
VVTTAYPLLSIATPFIFLAILPWFIVRSLRFNARITSYRNIRFDFTGTPLGAFASVLLGGLVSVFTLGILAPLSSRWVHRYVFNHLRYGDRGFETDPKLGDIYRGWLIPALMVVLGILIAIVAAWFLLAPFVLEMMRVSDSLNDQERLGITVLALYGVLIPLLFIFWVAGFVYRVAVRNVVMNSTLFDKIHPLYSDLSRGRFFWIFISNLVITLFTLGLMRPWAAVREARYMAEHSGVIPQGDVGEIMASIQASGSAISAEYMDMEGMDFGF